MNQKTKSRVPIWYWMIVAMFLLWNLMGCLFFGMELFAQEEFMKSMTDAEKEWARSTPSWIYFVYGLAVLTGFAGCIGLFVRQGWSVSILGISLLSVLVQMVYTMIIAGGLQVTGAKGLFMPSVVIVLSATLLWFSFWTKAKGWLV